MEDRRTQTAIPMNVRRLADLETAIARDEIEIVFQPQVEIATGRIVSVEALARWRHPEHGQIGPGELLDIAVRSQVMPGFSHHIRQRALEIAANWPEQLSTLRLSINVTSEDIAEPNFVNEMRRAIAASGLLAERLTLEITEAGPIGDLQGAAAKLEQLRADGIRIALDDFGSGYSSIAYLRALPVDSVKLDHDLSAGIGEGGKPDIIVSHVIAMAQALGLAIIAEGVETEGQLRLLARAGCDYYQGFLCAQAIDSVTLVDLIRDWPECASS